MGSVLGYFENIIKAAGTGPLALIALLSLLLAYIASQWFSRDTVWVRLAVFAALFGGTAALALAIVGETSIDNGEGSATDVPLPGASSEQTPKSDGEESVPEIRPAKAATAAISPTKGEAMITPPVVANCYQGPFIVFFEWNQDTILREAREVLNNSLDAYRGCRNVVVMVSGHDDSASDETASDMISKSRALNVANYLAAQGIASDRIKPVYFGSRELLVPTPDGVRNDQNRRVEITFAPII